MRAETGLEIYLEPGEAIALDAGILVGELLDVFDNGMPVGITDISATCHMPDVIEAPYRPAMLGERETAPQSASVAPPASQATSSAITACPFPPNPGQRFAFLDQAHYSMVKTTHLQRRPAALDLAVEQRKRRVALCAGIWLGRVSGSAELVTEHLLAQIANASQVGFGHVI